MSEKQKPVNPITLHKAAGVEEKPRLPEPKHAQLSQPERNENLLGIVLDDKYHIIKKIGSGGMGEVYLARHTKIDKMVAIKVLKSVSYYYSLFQKEVLAAISIEHDNVISMFGYGKTPEGNPFIAMEYLEGMDLDSLLVNKKRLNWPMARDIILQVCDALRTAHQKGVIHLDIKPMNVFIVNCKKPCVKVLDFGISQLSGDVAGIDISPTKGFIGTPAYAAPEQSCGSGECDHRSDLYAVGVMLYEMLCGSLPFISAAEESKIRVKEIISMHRNSKPPPFSAHGLTVGIPDGVESAVMRCLEKRKEDRFQSMTELMQALLAIKMPSRQMQAMSGMPMDDHDPRPQRRPADSSFGAGLVAVAFIAAMALVGYFWVYKSAHNRIPDCAGQVQPVPAVKPNAAQEHTAKKKLKTKKYNFK